MKDLIEKAGDAIDIRPLGSSLSRSKTTTLIRTEELDILRLVVLKGREIPTHFAPGAIVVQCLEGGVEFTAGARSQELVPGQLLCLPAGEPHSLKGLDDSSLLLTIVRADCPRFDLVDEAAEESFPASDPPSWTPTRP